MHHILLTTLLLGLVVGGCQKNLCSDAAALYTRCTGKQLVPLQSCDEAAAEFILAQDCRQFVSGKSDGSGCPSTVGDCPYTLKIRQETITRVPKIPSVVLFVAPSESNERTRVLVMQDSSSVLQDGEKLATSALEEKLAQAGAVRSWYSKVSAGTEIRVREDDKNYFIRCDEVERTSQIEGPGIRQHTTHVAFTVGLLGDEAEKIELGKGETMLLDGLLAAKDQLSFRHGTDSYVLEVDELTPGELKGKITQCASIPCTAGGQDQPTNDFTCALALTTPNQKASVPCTLPGGALNLWYQHTQAAGCSATPATEDAIQVDPVAEMVSLVPSPNPTISVTVDAAKVVIRHDGAVLNADDSDNTIQVVLDQSDTGEANDLAGTLRVYEGSTNPKDNAEKAQWLLTATVSGLAPGKYGVKLFGPDQNGALSETGTTELLHDDTFEVPASDGSTPSASATSCPPFVHVRAFGAPATVPEPTTPTGEPDLLPQLSQTIDEATGKVTIEGKVTNQGTADSVATTLKVTVLNSSNGTQKLPSVEVPVLAAKADHPWSREVTLAAGTYIVMAELASQAKSTKTASTEKFEVPSRDTDKANLTVTMPKPTIDATSGKVSITGTVCNEGSATAPDTSVQVVLYDQNKSQLETKTLSVPSLTTTTSGKCHTWPAVELVLQPASYSVTATVDSSDEKTDTKKASISFDVPARTTTEQVDLRVGTITVQPMGDLISITVQVCNDSMAATPAFRVGLYLTDAQPQCGQQSQEYLHFHNGLQPNQCDTRTSAAIAPGSATTVWALADADCKVPDPNAANNAKAYQKEGTSTPQDQDDGCHIGGGNSAGDGAVPLVLALLALLRRRRR